MLIKYLCQVGGEKVVVFLEEATSLDEPLQIQYSGSVAAATVLQEWLSTQYGPFAHLIGEYASPSDLEHVMSGNEAKRLYSPALTEGAELTGPYPQVDEGTVT